MTGDGLCVLGRMDKQRTPTVPPEPIVAVELPGTTWRLYKRTPFKVTIIVPQDHYVLLSQVVVLLWGPVQVFPLLLLPALLPACMVLFGCLQKPGRLTAPIFP